MGAGKTVCSSSLNSLHVGWAQSIGGGHRPERQCPRRGQGLHRLRGCEESPGKGELCVKHVKQVLCLQDFSEALIYPCALQASLFFFFFFLELTVF